MTHRVTTGLSTGGGALAIKRSNNEADAVRLEHEAAVLRLVRHPGVVELVACECDEAGVVTLVTEFVGLHSLDTVDALTVVRAAEITASVASTLADLHDVGIVHGRVEPSHVLIGANGRPKLCGLGGATTDGSRHPGVDVAGAGAVLLDLLARTRADTWARYQRRALATLADQATDPEPGRRPPARRFAASIRDLVPETDGASGRRSTRRWRWWSRRAD
jgi:serine/threonine protein kinase